MSTVLPEAKKHKGACIVLFTSAFSYEDAPNITHVTVDYQRTLCGRRDWATEEEYEVEYGWDFENGICCMRCLPAYQKYKLRRGKP